MAGDKDIFGKADALLRRHALQPPADGSQTGGVPLLTDLVDDPAAATPAPAARDDITPDVLARVVAQVEARLAEQLEDRIVQQLLPQVHAAVVHALGDLRPELGNAIGDAVAEALRTHAPK